MNTYSVPKGDVICGVHIVQRTTLTGSSKQSVALTMAKQQSAIVATKEKLKDELGELKQKRKKKEELHMLVTPTKRLGKKLAPFQEIVLRFSFYRFWGQIRTLSRGTEVIT